MGPWLTPLKGKVPILGAWQTRAPAGLDDVIEWRDIGHNLGFRTGAASGLVVIDDDQARQGVPKKSRWVAPPTGLIAETPTGGTHHFYAAPDPCVGNSTSKLAPYVDVRGEGGQVVYAGSRHPNVKRILYRWISTGEPGTLPQEVLDALTQPEKLRVDMTAKVVPKGVGYAQTALFREVARVRGASGGTRNDTLNRAAFSLGQLVAGGVLQLAEVEEQLTSAAKLVGDGQAGEDRKISSTLKSGLKAGMARPRTAPQPTVTATKDRPSEQGNRVLVFGSHQIPPLGDYLTVNTVQFSDAVLAGLEPGSIYRFQELVGEVVESKFEELGPDRTRLIVDKHVSLCAGKEKDGEYSYSFRTCTRDHAGLVLAHARDSHRVRRMDLLATYPVCVGEECETAKPGWNAKYHVLLATDHVPDPLNLATSKAVLEDLVIDFPFQTPADRSNFFGLMLTPILRPALDEPVPMHLIDAMCDRTGKSLLAEIVLGCSILGRPTPPMQIGKNEEEHDKRILSALTKGNTAMHLDNLGDFLDSAPLASLLTSRTYSGRILGATRMVEAKNTLTIVGTGNKVKATSEIAKRIVPIILQSDMEHPEARTDFKHLHIQPYAQSQRMQTLAALLGLIDAWRKEGRPMGSVGFGGFGRWSAVIGGIMQVAGYDDWLTNMARWRGDTDGFGEDAKRFVEGWLQKWGTVPMRTADLFGLVEDLGLFEKQLWPKDERSRRVAFGRKVISPIEGRVIAGHQIRLTGRGRDRKAQLVEFAV